MRNVTPSRPLDSGRDPDQDSGVVLVWVAIMMLVLLGVGALVIDIGRMLVEARELQNGADAAVLAIAQDCAGEVGCGDVDATAKTYADDNAKDGLSAVELVCVGPADSDCAKPSGAENASGWVRVGTETETETGDQVDFLLAPVMNLFGATVHRDAAAAWGATRSATTLPFTFSECEYLQLPTDATGFPSGLTTIYSKAGNSGGGNSGGGNSGGGNSGGGNSGGGNSGGGNSGGDPDVPPEDGCEPRSSPGGYVEGGFGWLNTTSGTCSVDLEIREEGTVLIGPSNPGNSNLLDKAPCDESLVQGQVVKLPLFNEVNDTGNNAEYTISGFVAFRVTAYDLSGSSWSESGGKFSCPQPPDDTGQGGNLRCFQGYFQRDTVSGGDFGGIDFGLTTIKMVE